MLRDAAQRAADLARDPAGTTDQIAPVLQTFFDALRDPAAPEAAGALGVLAGGIDAPDEERAALLAMGCGAAIERGVPPDGAIEPILRRLRGLAGLARQLFDAACGEISPDAEDFADRFDAARAAKAQALPEAARAWERLEQSYMPAIALFSASPAARRQASDLLLVLEPMRQLHAGAQWLTRVLQVLDDEPYLALEPATGRGIEGRMSGISENFQLNVLLMDVFPNPGWFAKRRVSPAAAAVARGDGPQQRDDIITGRWNLYAWTGVRLDGSLPDPRTLDGAHWIWNEGFPADIPIYDNRRVILLGPPSYERNWRSQRDFAALRAKLTVDKELSRTEVEDWMQRLAAAAGKR